MNDIIVQEVVDIFERGNLVILVFDLYCGKVVIDYEIVGYYMFDLDWLGVV